MADLSFAGSNGLMEVSAPAWIQSDEHLFSQWGKFLLALIKHGQATTLKRGERLQIAPAEFGLLIDGGLYLLDSSETDSARSMLIQILARGDLFTGSISNSLRLQLTPHVRTHAIVVRQGALEAFKAEFPEWDRVMPLLHAKMAHAYSQAVIETTGLDQQRIKRVLTMLASHPTACDTKFGREIEAGKQQIRDLAGVQKRSASRAFRALEEAGYVSFYGYKRLFFKEPT